MLMIMNTIIDEIKNKSISINDYNKYNYETKIRIDTINNYLNTINEMLDDLELEFNRDRKYVSDKVKQMIIENDKREDIIDTFLPYMILYNTMKNDNIKNKLDISNTK